MYKSSNVDYQENKKKNIKLICNLTQNSNCIDSGIVNSFTVFKSINGIYYLIYSNFNNSVNSYDLNQQKIIIELKGCHNYKISNIIYYLDKKNNKDLIMTISYEDNNLKLWNVNNWECLINILNVNKKGLLFSGCFLNKNNQNYIITSNLNWNDDPENIKIFDFNGNKIKEINKSNDNVLFIDTFYDIKLNKYYILTGNKDYVKSYDYNINKLYKKYEDNNSGNHNKVIIKNDEKIIKLIDSCSIGNIRIWNFHSGLLLNKIKVNYGYLMDICLWNNNYIFVGSSDCTIKLINIKNNLTIKSIRGHLRDVTTIKKIILPRYGECLVSQGYGNDQIKLWLIS